MRRERAALTTEPGTDTDYRFRHEVEVRFRDLDAMGHVHHTLPLVYFEEARAAYWRAVAGRSDVGDVDYIIGQVTVRYHARIRYPARLSIGVRVCRLGTKSLTIEHEARAPDGTLLATGTAEQVMFDYAAGRSMPIPPDLRRRIETFEGLDVAAEPPPSGPA